MNVTQLVAAAEGHLFTSGLFDGVSRHEPKSSPGHGVTAALWLMSVRPVPGRSGLVATTGRVELRVRLYVPMLREPMDEIDPTVLELIDAIMSAYSGGFTLGGLVKHVDLLGEVGEPLSARSGYLNQDNTMYRVVDITLPLVVNDLWEQEA